MTERHDESFAAKPWQQKISRRGFMAAGAALAGAAGLAGYLPDSLARAAEKASAATPGPFDLSQIKHLVFFMQENRSFDHYFGTYPGVRGFSDPNAITLPDGRSVFQQPDPDNPDGFLEPWHMSTITSGAAATPSLSHDWRTQHEAWDFGRLDTSLLAHTAFDGPVNGPRTMGYYTQEDLPFHWALAHAFTLCDHYHCSVLGPTTPNRFLWQLGTLDPQGLGGGPVLETTTNPPTLTFNNVAEDMYNAGITFKWYAGAVGNGEWSAFANVKNGTLPTALLNSINAGTALFGNGTPGGIGNPNSPTPATNPIQAFEEDLANGVLPDVSFVNRYDDFSQEHPPQLPALGAQVIARRLDLLAANEDLWNTTVFVLQYDENDGFFDHVPPPTPDRAEFPEEFVTLPSTVNGTPGLGYPVGSGFRVPAFIISPWSTGGRIFSGLSDHTSCLRLIESVAAAGGLSGRDPVYFPTVSRWRRQTFGDLTAALVASPAQPAPTSRQFDPAVRAANAAAQTATSTLPQPTFPGRDQTMPVQQEAIENKK